MNAPPEQVSTARRSNLRRLMIIGMLDALVAVVVSLGTHNIFYGLTAAVLAHIAVAMGVVFVEAARGLRTSWHR